MRQIQTISPVTLRAIEDYVQHFAGLHAIAERVCKCQSPSLLNVDVAILELPKPHPTFGEHVQSFQAPFLDASVPEREIASINRRSCELCAAVGRFRIDPEDVTTVPQAIKQLASLEPPPLIIRATLFEALSILKSRGGLSWRQVLTSLVKPDVTDLTSATLPRPPS